MFWHNFKYEFIHGIRQKDIVFWMILFPIALGTFFSIAFSDIYEKTTKFNTVPVAIVENQKNETFESVIKQITQGKEPLFKAKYTTEKKALDMLEKEDIDGIIFVDKELSMTVADDGISQTIIKSFLEQYKMQEKIITDTVKTNPAQLDSVITALSEEISANENIPLTDGNTDNLIQYFYNLIAMVALFGCMAGLSAAIGNQGNLSAIGARKCCSPTNKLLSVTASLVAACAVQAICVIIAVSYLAFVLRVDFSDRLPMVYLSGIISSFMGVSLGFFIGSIGSKGESFKGAILMAVTMTSCFLSGLMIGNMKAVCAEFAPWFNRINPATVISDTFYCLNVYNDYDRYMEKIITILIMMFVFTAGGFILTRRRKYASL